MNAREQLARLRDDMTKRDVALAEFGGSRRWQRYEGQTVRVVNAVVDQGQVFLVWRVAYDGRYGLGGNRPRRISEAMFRRFYRKVSA